MTPVSTSVNSVTHIAKMTNVAGMERHLLQLLPGLKAHGLDVRLIVLVNPNTPMDGYVDEMQRLGVSAEQVVIQRHFDPALIAQLADKLKGADTVHTHLIHADLHGVLAAKRAGIGNIYSTAHNDDSFRHYLPVRLMQAWLWRQVRAGIAISEALRRFLINVEFAPADRIHTVHYGFDPASLAFAPDAQQKLCTELGVSQDAQLVVSLCRLVAQKGLTYSIEAFRQIAYDFPNAHYVIVGEGKLRAELEAQVAAADLQGCVHFLGWRSDMRSLLTGFDLMLMPSLWEGFGLVLLEGMAAQLPIIASNVSAIPEIVVDGETGYLVPPADSSAIAQRLRTLLDDPATRHRLGECGRARLDSVFSVAQMVEATLRVYGQVP